VNRIFTARFQPFHMGHLAVLEKILNIYSSNIIIGVVIFDLNDASTNPIFDRLHPINNPFSFWDIRRMIASVIRERELDVNRQISILPIPAIQVWWSLTQRLLPTKRTWIAPEGEYLNKDRLEFEKLGEKFETFIPPKRKTSGKIVRYRLAFDKDWDLLVPDSVRKILTDIHAENTMMRLYSEYNIANLDETDLR